MTVYVDPLFTWESKNPAAFKVGERNRHRWCHMACDGDITELHALAQQIGMKREWFQTPDRFPHYDLTPGKRAQAVAAGAVEITLSEMGTLVARWSPKGDLHPRLPKVAPRAKPATPGESPYF